MTVLCRHIASEITKHIPTLVLGQNMLIGPPRPYETTRDGREGGAPLSVFINESGGLRDVRSVGTRDTHIKRWVKIIIRSNKVNYVNDGGRGAFAEGMKMTNSIASAIRMFDVEWVPDAVIYSQPIYLGKHEDDMHYWSMNVLTRSCENVGKIYYGEAGAVEDYSDIENQDCLESLIFSGTYNVTGTLATRYFLVPEDMVQGFSFQSYISNTDGILDIDPQEFSTQINGMDYRAIWFETLGLTNLFITVCDI